MFKYIKRKSDGTFWLDTPHKGGCYIQGRCGTGEISFSVKWTVWGDDPLPVVTDLIAWLSEHGVAVQTLTEWSHEASDRYEHGSGLRALIMAWLLRDTHNSMYSFRLRITGIEEEFLRALHPDFFQTWVMDVDDGGIPSDAYVIVAAREVEWGAKELGVIGGVSVRVFTKFRQSGKLAEAFQMAVKERCGVYAPIGVARYNDLVALKMLDGFTVYAELLYSDYVAIQRRGTVGRKMDKERFTEEFRKLLREK